MLQKIHSNANLFKDLGGEITSQQGLLHGSGGASGQYLGQGMREEMGGFPRKHKGFFNPLMRGKAKFGISKFSRGWGCEGFAGGIMVLTIKLEPWGATIYMMPYRYGVGR